MSWNVWHVRNSTSRRIMGWRKPRRRVFMANKALIVGINKYRLSGADLQGCVNDVTNIRYILIKYLGFKVKDIRALVDARATKKGIMDRLEWLVRDAKAGDRLLFHFSGHGSQIRDRDGDELKDHL